MIECNHDKLKMSYDVDYYYLNGVKSEIPGTRRNITYSCDCCGKDLSEKRKEYE